MMVISLPMLNKGSPYRSRKGSSSTSSSANASTTSFSPSGSHSSPNVITSSNSSSTLTEALRGNPFGGSSLLRSRSVDVLTSTSELDERRRDLKERNDALAVLAQLFPNVKVEVFRELLARFDGKSRLEVCVEQLIRYREEWVKGRWNDPSSTNSTSEASTSPSSASHTTAETNVDAGGSSVVGKRTGCVPKYELFRSDEYKKAVKTVLAFEFKSLSRSTIDAVLAEANFSYVRARPILRHLSRKTWRATLGNMLSFKKKKKNETEDDDPPLLVWHRSSTGEETPILKGTGCSELDKELYDVFLVPLLTQIRDAQEDDDLKLAEALNEAEAMASDALYECECCLSEVTFEQISTCSTSSHIICFNCIRRTLHEALFGQGWEKSIDSVRSTLQCLAPISTGICKGILDAAIVKRAVLAGQAGSETYRKFEDRLATEALLASKLKLIHCPFCSYAEVDPAFYLLENGMTWQFRRTSLIPSLLMIVLFLDLIPILIIPFAVLILFYPSALTAILMASLQNLYFKTRTQRFVCASPFCQRESCITCHKPWYDPHMCHEPLLLSLRTTVEAARTAAVKRTCPRCGLAFVKASGCNKLTCVCGYSMCYLCRKALGSRTPRERNYENVLGRPPHRVAQRQYNADDWNEENPQFMDGAVDRDLDNEPEEDEPRGYKHFCEHFRVNPGSQCTECTKCDLYRSEDDESVAQRAGEKAEREWRIRQGLAGNTPPVRLQLTDPRGNKTRSHHGKVPGPYWNWQFDSRTWKGAWRFWMQDLWRDGRWRIEGQILVDKLVETVVIVQPPD